MVPELVCAVLMVEGVEEGGCNHESIRILWGGGKAFHLVGRMKGRGCFLNILFIAVAIIC